MRGSLIILYVKTLVAESGVDEFSFENSTTTIAYQSVIVPGSPGQENRIGTLFITVPHTLAADVTSLITTQNLVNFAIIFAIVSISIIRNNYFDTMEPNSKEFGESKRPPN